MAVTRTTQSGNEDEARNLGMELGGSRRSAGSSGGCGWVEWFYCSNVKDLWGVKFYD